MNKKISRVLLIAVFIFSCILNLKSQNEFKLRNEVKKYLAASNTNFRFAMIAETHFTDSSATAFFWPCLINSALVDDKIIAVHFEKQDNEWEATEVFTSSTDSTLNKYNKLFSNKKYELIKPDGVQIDSIASYIQQLNIGTQKALAQEDENKVILFIEAKLSATAMLHLIYENEAKNLNVELKKYGAGWAIEQIKN
jgi:hypothetical protein